MFRYVCIGKALPAKAFCIAGVRGCSTVSPIRDTPGEIHENGPTLTTTASRLRPKYPRDFLYPQADGCIGGAVLFFESHQVR